MKESHAEDSQKSKMFQPRDYVDSTTTGDNTNAYDELPESFKRKLDTQTKVITDVNCFNIASLYCWL